MRRALGLGVAMLFAVSGTASAADAQTIGATAPGTVDLSISATGQSVKRADQVTIRVPITSSGATNAAAKAANSAAEAALINALVASGIDRRAITSHPGVSQFGFVGNEAYNLGALEAPQAPGNMARKTAHSVLQIRLTDTALISRVEGVLNQQNQAMNSTPLYSLRDDRAARNAAIADALANARQEADAYATPLGLRVDRITSVSNYGATRTSPDVESFMRMLAGTQEGDPDMVTTRAEAWVNFVLVPQ